MRILVSPATMWTLDQALAVVRELQPLLHARDYHVALGGGVLNRGQSDKDIDLYMFPFNGDHDIPAILPFLEDRWGTSTPIGIEPGDGYPPDINFQVRAKFTLPGGGRADVFITKNGVVRNAS